MKPPPYLVLGLDACEIDASGEEKFAFMEDAALVPLRSRDTFEPRFLLLLGCDDLGLGFYLFQAPSELLVVEEPCLPNDRWLMIKSLLSVVLLDVLVSLIELLLGLHQELGFR